MVELAVRWEGFVFDFVVGLVGVPEPIFDKLDRLAVVLASYAGIQNAECDRMAVSLAVVVHQE